VKLKNVSDKEIRDDTIRALPLPPLIIKPGETVELPRLMGLQIKQAFAKGRLEEVKEDEPKVEEKFEVNDDAMQKKKIKTKKKKVIKDTYDKLRLEE